MFFCFFLTNISSYSVGFNWWINCSVWMDEWWVYVLIFSPFIICVHKEWISDYCLSSICQTHAQLKVFCLCFSDNAQLMIIKSLMLWTHLRCTSLWTCTLSQIFWASSWSGTKSSISVVFILNIANQTNVFIILACIVAINQIWLFQLGVFQFKNLHRIKVSKYSTKI